MTPDNGKIFNRPLYRLRRNRAAAGWAAHDFLKHEAALRLVERMQDMAREFPLSLDLGCHHGEFAAAVAGKDGIKTLIQCDAAQNMLRGVAGITCVSDEEFLPFAENSFDLVVSALSLHHVNDLPGTLIQIQRCLKPDGLFLAILPGAHSFKELRASIAGASAEHDFALTPRVSPFVEVRDAGALLMRAGFALPVVDSEVITAEYENILSLMKDMRGMGESSVLLEQRRGFTPRTQIAAMESYYRRHFALPDGALPVTIEFITLTGWKPHASQQKPLARGSGKVSLKQVL